MHSASASSLQSTGLGNQERNPIKDVFGNSVIWRKLSQYLDFEDFLKLRMTNRFFYNQIYECQPFIDQMAIHMTDDAIKDRKFLEFIEQFPKWKSLSVTLWDTKQRDVNLMAFYFPLILKAEVKELKCYWKEGMRSPKSNSLGTVIFGLITQMPQLTKLEIEFVLLARIEFWGASIQSKGILKNVTDFKIFHSKPTNQHQKLSANFFKYNMRFFETSFFSLKNLTIEELPDIAINTIAKVHLLIKNNCSTLESLTILYSIIWHKTRMGQIVCPKLKRLETNVKVGYYNDTYLKSFLKNQPPLEIIKLSVEGSLDDDILTILNYKHSRNLKTLHIKTHKIENENSVSPFQFLSSTNVLDFSLVVPRRSGHGRTFSIAECEALLQYLPPTVQKFKLEGLELSPTSTFSYNRLHFSRLTKCEFLTTLEVVDCKGLSGNRFWIKDLCALKGLQTLVISRLNLNDGDVFPLKLATLRNLDVSGNKWLSRTAVQRMISQMPSLELLICSQYGIQTVGRLGKIVLKDLELWTGTSSDSDD